MNSGWIFYGNFPPSWDIQLGLASFLLVQKLDLPRNQAISLQLELKSDGDGGLFARLLKTVLDSDFEVESISKLEEGLLL